MPCLYFKKQFSNSFGKSLMYLMLPNITELVTASKFLLSDTYRKRPIDITKLFSSLTYNIFDTKSSIL